MILEKSNKIDIPINKKKKSHQQIKIHVDKLIRKTIFYGDRKNKAIFRTMNGGRFVDLMKEFLFILRLLIFRFLLGHRSQQGLTNVQ